MTHQKPLLITKVSSSLSTAIFEFTVTDKSTFI